VHINEEKFELDQKVFGKAKNDTRKMSAVATFRADKSVIEALDFDVKRSVTDARVFRNYADTGPGFEDFPAIKHQRNLTGQQHQRNSKEVHRDDGKRMAAKSLSAALRPSVKKQKA